MQFISVVALFAAAAMASPTPRTTQAGTCNVAGVLYGQAQCCATNVLNVAALDCKNPTEGDSHYFTCGSEKPSCCSIPVAGQGLLCKDAILL
ncbi:hypothetical protein VHEMI00562 [[Torrubiella] hemipterigena]|uniref:Hydrophobin n=1 Tax=[Torrubiella] hemipterigena TaxID=1531966 RepID=A0A0A1T299_9HYPO|nr:hypothetical protein VHEMI00562 [[Torrubiella] hemipterigena]